MEHFQRLGNEIELLWLKRNYSEADFPSIAAAALQRADLPSKLSAWDAVEWWFDVRYWPFLLSILGLVAMAMIFAMRNHRSAERGNLRVVRQLLVFASCQAVVTLATYIFWSWYTWLY